MRNRLLYRMLSVMAATGMLFGNAANVTAGYTCGPVCYEPGDEGTLPEGTGSVIFPF